MEGITDSSDDNYESVEYSRAQLISLQSSKLQVEHSYCAIIDCLFNHYHYYHYHSTLLEYLPPKNLQA